MKPLIKVLSSTFVLILLSAVWNLALSQPPPPPDVQPIPIDGGLIFLIIAGIGLSYYKTKQHFVLQKKSA